MLAFYRGNARWLAGGLLLTLFSSFWQTFFSGLSGIYLLEEFALSDGEFRLIYMGCMPASDSETRKRPHDERRMTSGARIAIGPRCSI